jgi:transcriptional antiterminator RfaH
MTLPDSDCLPAGRQWFVVRAKNKKERYAVQQLERRGVAVFLPRILEYRGQQVAPLFPGYLFVHVVLVDQYYRVVWSPGVRSFVGFGGGPTPVSEHVIQLIRESAGEDGIIRPRAPFHPGDRVEIRSGPFAGLVAIVQHPCSQRGRVKVLLDFLRQGVSAELPIGVVNRV